MCILNTEGSNIFESLSSKVSCHWIKCRSLLTDVPLLLRHRAAFGLMTVRLSQWSRAVWGGRPCCAPLCFVSLDGFAGIDPLVVIPGAFDSCWSTGGVALNGWSFFTLALAV